MLAKGRHALKILMVNKFLYPNGGSETYIFKLGEYFQSVGHEVQYFGMDHESRVVGNTINAYTASMDFHKGSYIDKLFYPIKTIYSSQARKKIRQVLDQFQPDVCHLNNFNYQLTPSIILEIVKWRKQTGHTCKIIYTAHDYQLVCPNHMCHNPNTHENCENCLHGRFFSCTKGKCIHGSTVRSLIGTIEASIWNLLGVYRHIDSIICCSHFMKKKIDSNPIFASKTVVMHNFVTAEPQSSVEKKDYVLYFGRYSQEKGIPTLLDVCKQLPQIRFIFAGSGPLADMLKGIPNIENVGFQSGEALRALIREARFSLYPSEWYENCPFSVMESQMYGTPVLAADIGGIPELIESGKTGELFESGNPEALRTQLSYMWHHYADYDCTLISCKTVEQYATNLLNHYSSNC